MHNTSSEPLDLDPVFDPTSLHHSSGDCDNDNNNVTENPAAHASSSAEVEVDPLVFKKSSNESSSLRRSRTTRTTHNSNHTDDDEATQEDTEDHYYTKEDLLRYQQKRKLRQQKRSLSNRKLREKIGTSPSAASSSKKNKASTAGDTTTSSEHTKEDSRTRKSRQQQRQSASYSPPPPGKKRSNSKEKSSSSRQARPRNKRTDSSSKLLRKNASRSRTNSSRSLNANNKKSTRSKSRQKTRENSSRRLSVDELFAEAQEGGKGSKGISESKSKTKANDSAAVSPPKSPKSPSTHKKGKASILSMSSPPSPSQRKKEKRRSKSAGRTKQLQEVESLTGVALLDVNGSTVQVKTVKRTKSRGRASHKTSKSLDDAAFSDLMQAQGGEKSKNNKREMKREKSSSRMSSSSNNNKENKRASLSKSPSSIKTPPPSDPPSSPSSHSKKSLRQSLQNDSNSSSTKEPRKRSNLKRSGSLRVTQRERYESKEEQPTTTTATTSRHNAPSPNKINVSKSRRRASLNGPSDGNNTASMVPNKSGASRRQSLDVGASGMQQPLLQRSKSWSIGDEDEHEHHHKRSSVFRTTSQRVTAKEHKDQTLRARHGRRAAFKRYKSQLNVSGAKPKESGSSNNLESNKKKKKSQRSSGKKAQKTSLLDLISTPNKPDMLERKSSLRFATAKGVGIDDAVTSSPKKAVRFATNDSGERVWCLVKTVPKQPSSARAAVWWTEQELDERQEKDLHVLSLVQDKYRPTLSRTFESARKPLAKLESVELAGESLSACALARGLEHQVLFPEWPDHRKKHIKAVLAAQSLIQCQQDAQQQNSMFLFNDSELKLLRLQSLKLSRTSQLVALKLAELDQALANEDDGDNSESESGS